MASKSSSSSSSSNQTFYDQRAITTVDDRDTTTTNTYRGGDTTVDSSNRSTNTTNITTSDPGVLKLGELQAQLMGAVAESQSDAVKAVAGLGRDAFRDLAGSLTNVSATNERAWSHTVDASERTISGLLESSKASTDAAKAIAGAAIASYQPTENKQADVMKWAGVAAAVIALAFVFRPRSA